MAAILTDFNYGRLGPQGDVCALPVTVAANGATYTSASGGLPIDLAGILNAAAQSGQMYINPADVVGIVPAFGLSTNGYMVGALNLAGVALTPGGLAAVATYVTGTGNMTVRPDYIALATCPCNIRLNGIGASNASGAAFGEVANGANTDTFSFLLLIARGGTNQ
jgi:hypothetical protein